MAEKKKIERQIEEVEVRAQWWEEKAALAVNRGRDDLARAALQEKRDIEEELSAVDTELAVTDGHIEQLNEEIAKLQQKLTDAKASSRSWTWVVR